VNAGQLPDKTKATPAGGLVVCRGGREVCAGTKNQTFVSMEVGKVRFIALNSRKISSITIGFGRVSASAIYSLIKQDLINRHDRTYFSRHT
jgi:choline kinase